MNVSGAIRHSFSAISLATVGYGDFAPHTDAGKLLTVFYVFCGIGLLVALLSRFAEALVESHRENKERLHVHLAHAHEKLTPHGAGVGEPGPAEAPAAEGEHVP